MDGSNDHESKSWKHPINGCNNQTLNRMESQTRGYEYHAKGKFNAWQDGQEPLPNELGFQSIPWSQVNLKSGTQDQASLIRVSWCIPPKQGLQTKHEASQSIS